MSTSAMVSPPNSRLHASRCDFLHQSSELAGEPLYVVEAGAALHGLEDPMLDALERGPIRCQLAHDGNVLVVVGRDAFSEPGFLQNARAHVGTKAVPR